ncbi:MAG: hypothetical protein AAB482_04420, partial [Patescibacteria group bacterium]
MPKGFSFISVGCCGVGVCTAGGIIFGGGELGGTVGNVEGILGAFSGSTVVTVGSINFGAGGIIRAGSVGGASTTFLGAGFGTIG